MNEREFVKQIQEELEQSAQNIDAQTRSRLTQARYMAIDKAGKKAFNPFLLPMTALATACLVMAIVIYLPKESTEQIDIVDDLDLISSSESLEFFEELEFYEWLEEYELPT